MRGAATILVVYGLFVIAGGVLGYARSSSEISLVTGGVAGALAVLAGVGLRRGRGWAFPLGLAVTLALAAFFAWRLVQTGALMPAGVTLAFSLVAAFALLAAGRRSTRAG